MSWAAIAQKAPPKVEHTPIQEEQKKRVAVIDANAIITASGLLNLVKEADRVVTTPEVLNEVRDKQSRATLAALPFKIEIQDPSEDAVAAVTKFARATGDNHALSSQDVRLIALARTIEASYYGTEHLRDAPPPPKVQKKSKRQNQMLPGWGAEGGEWSELDRLNEEEIAAAEAALRGSDASRIASEVQQLNLDDTATSSHQPANGNQQLIAAAQEGEGDLDDSDSDAAANEDDDDGWEVAAKTPNKTRRQRRRSMRKAMKEEEQQQDDDDMDDDGSEYTEEDDSEDGESDDDDQSELSDALASKSLVCIVTADFAMQNVILQMGLRLAAPDGKQITSVSRWVLRCTACFNVTKETGRLFCPKCGNSSLDRVHVTVGADGAEQYGVRKKHVLRGTKFSLPKPKGGRHNDIILTEDILMLKAKRLARKNKKKEELDPFAPEFNDETWHQKAALGANDRSTSALAAGWKKNPNERKHIATNRRRK